MASYDMQRRIELLTKASTSSSGAVKGKKRPVPQQKREDSLLLDGQEGYLLLETNDRMLLDK